PLNSSKEAMSRVGPEYEGVQQPAIALLRDHFDYRYMPGEELEERRGSEAEVILGDVLAERLKVINPGITDNGIRDTIDALRQPLVKNLIEANEACHLHLSRWVTITEFRDGKPAHPSIRLFDFDEPANNDFLI